MKHACMRHHTMTPYRNLKVPNRYGFQRMTRRAAAFLALPIFSSCCGRHLVSEQPFIERPFKTLSQSCLTVAGEANSQTGTFRDPHPGSARASIPKVSDNEGCSEKKKKPRRKARICPGQSVSCQQRSVWAEYSESVSDDSFRRAEIPRRATKSPKDRRVRNLDGQ